MGPAINKYPGRYFEDINVGDVIVFKPFVISDSEARSFGDLTKDLNPLHFDAEFCEIRSLFRRPVIHGLAVIARAIGTVSEDGFWDGTCMAFLGANELRFRRPVFPGDELQLTLTVTAKNAKEKCGLIDFFMEIKKTKTDAAVIAGGISVMIAKSVK